MRYEARDLPQSALAACTEGWLCVCFFSRKQYFFWNFPGSQRNHRFNAVQSDPAGKEAALIQAEGSYDLKVEIFVLTDIYFFVKVSVHHCMSRLHLGGL